MNLTLESPGTVRGRVNARVAVEPVRPNEAFLSIDGVITLWSPADEVPPSRNYSISISCMEHRSYSI